MDTTAPNTPELTEYERVIAILSGTREPRPIISVTFLAPDGQPDETTIPERLQKALTLLYLQFMTKEILLQEQQLAILLTDTKEAYILAEQLHEANQKKHEANQKAETKE